MSLTGGSLLQVMQGKRVYQPIWQILSVNINQSQSGPVSTNLLVSDGVHVSHSVYLHPNPHITFNNKMWKSQKNGRNPEDVLGSCRFPIVKVMECSLQMGETSRVVILSKLKMMGWENVDRIPAILKSSDVEVITRDCQVVVKSKEGLMNFDTFDCVEFSDPSESEEDLRLEMGLGDNKNLLDMASMGSMMRQKTKVRITEADLTHGDLAALGPAGLNILAVCEKCRNATFSVSNSFSQFKPSSKSLLENLADILPDLDPSRRNIEFCCCDDENEQFRKEFQNKCMVVNQDSGPGSDKKVQCILVSKDQQSREEKKMNLKQIESKLETKLEVEPELSKDGISCIVPLSAKVVRVSSRLKLCEHCGVEERDMSACRHCGKAWYCSGVCRKADVTQHTAVCRAYITTRRATEEKAELARALQEPLDGCDTCGFWRSNLESCNKCGKAWYCSYRCKDRAAEKHKPVCEAFLVIQNYRKRYLLARSQEVD